MGILAIPGYRNSEVTKDFFYLDAAKAGRLSIGGKKSKQRASTISSGRSSRGRRAMSVAENLWEAYEWYVEPPDLNVLLCLLGREGLKVGQHSMIYLSTVSYLEHHPPHPIHCVVLPNPNNRLASTLPRFGESQYFMYLPYKSGIVWLKFPLWQHHVPIIAHLYLPIYLSLCWVVFLIDCIQYVIAYCTEVICTWW